MEPSQVYRRDIVEIEGVMPMFQRPHEDEKPDDKTVHLKHFVFPEGMLPPPLVSIVKLPVLLIFCSIFS
jgi:hypothetical protein